MTSFSCRHIDFSDTLDLSFLFCSHRCHRADTGIADGIKVDTKGNVYTGSGTLKADELEQP